MKARILFLGDLHKRDVDFTTITGYTRAIDEVQHDILKFIPANGITHLVSLGDWYDKGYRSINRTNNDRNLDEALSAAVNGNFYICLGNHFFLERDNNPEMYLIQPSNMYKPTHPIYATRPVIQAPSFFQVGGVRISLFHYSKTHKNYHMPLTPDVTYHIGVYHDEAVVPHYAQERGGLVGAKPAGDLQFMLENVNLAIVGHLHKPVGAIKIPVNGRQVTMFIPGSLANTSNGPQYHEEVSLPVIDIADDDTVSCKLFTFSLHCELLKRSKRAESRLKALQPDQAITDIPQTIGLRDYLHAKGYTEQHVHFIEEAAERQLDAVTGLQLLGLVKEKKQNVQV